MSKCKNCGGVFTPCIKPFETDIEYWNTYCCSISCAKQYLENIKKSRGISNNKTDENILNKVRDEGIVELQNSRLEQYKKQDEIVTSEVVEEPINNSYIRRRKNV